MSFLAYILGIITGLLLSIFFVFIDILIHRKVAPGGLRQIIKQASREKGEILEPQDESLDAFINSLPKE